MKTPGYDRLARPYRLIETLAYGRALERARFAHFEQLRDRRHILMLGDGDGRGLVRACRLAPLAKIDWIDSSAGMLERAAQRLRPEDRERVTFRHENALAAEVTVNTYDAITTLFFLDCFSAQDAGIAINRFRPALTADGVWLYADFALPDRGWSRLRAQFWIKLMLVFFRWQTRLTIKQLPPAEALLNAAGLATVAGSSWHGGFLRSIVCQPQEKGASPDTPQSV